MSDEQEVSAINTLSAKIDELTKSLGEKKVQAEEKIKENPIAYVMGAFVGGLLVGYLMGRRNNNS